jgi:hypothetical protein
MTLETIYKGGEHLPAKIFLDGILRLRVCRVFHEQHNYKHNDDNEQS